MLMGLTWVQDAGRMTGDAALIPGIALRNPVDHDETACPEGSLRRSSVQSQLRADGHEGVSSEICQLTAIQRIPLKNSLRPLR